MVCSFFSYFFSALVHKATWEFGDRILSEEPLLEGGQGIEGQLEIKQVPLNKTHVREV